MHCESSSCSHPSQPFDKHYDLLLLLDPAIHAGLLLLAILDHFFVGKQKLPSCLLQQHVGDQLVELFQQFSELKTLNNFQELLVQASS